MHGREVRWPDVQARKQAVQPCKDLPEDGEEEVMKPKNREWLLKMIAEAPDTPPTPAPRPLPRPIAKKQDRGDRARKLTSGERNFFKRKFGEMPPDNMTLGEFRSRIRNARKEGGFD